MYHQKYKNCTTFFIFSLHIVEYATSIEPSENVRNERSRKKTRTYYPVIQWRHTGLPNVAQEYRGNHFAIQSTVITSDFASCSKFVFSNNTWDLKYWSHTEPSLAQNISYIYLIPGDKAILKTDSTKMFKEIWGFQEYIHIVFWVMITRCHNPGDTLLN